MSVLNTLLTVLIAIGVGFAIGQFLFRRCGESSRTVSTMIGTGTGVFWTIVGIFMIIGGFIIGGILVMAVAWYLARGNYREYKLERGVRSRVANGG